MAFLGKIFRKEKSAHSKGFHTLEVKDIRKLTADSVQISFVLPESLNTLFHFVPGQYITLALDIDGESVRRSYSICSGQNEDLAIGVKKIENGKVSGYLTTQLTIGDSIPVSKPEGNFNLPREAKNVVAIAAGSGITPILSMAKEFKGEGTFRLYYANRKEQDILFREDLDALNRIDTNYFLTGEDKEGFGKGRLDRDGVSRLIQNDLSLLRSDVFLLCGPSDMILAIKDLLKMFGVSEDKIRFELFTPPTAAATAEPEATPYSGNSNVTIQLDNDRETIVVSSDTSILDAGIQAGIDLPYSCKGGVCSTCRAKVLEGKVNMRLNYSLTDKEVAEGYVLSCQAHPASDKIKISFDE